MLIQLEKRILRLERVNSILLILLLAMGSMFVIASDNDDVDEDDFKETVRCGRLEIVDDQDRLVTVVGVDEEGSRGLFVYDEREVVRSAVFHDINQSAFYAFDSGGTVRLGAAHFAHGGSGYALHGANSKGAVALYYKSSGTLTLYDTSGTVTNRWPNK